MWFRKLVVVFGFMSVNSYGVIGSLDNDNQEECAACSKGSCRSINGIYTRPDLPPGYSLVAQIPKGACRILVQQLKHTRNLLALKNSNGSFIVNGDWKFSTSRVVEGAGTKFNYIRQDGNSLETISSPGPLSNTVDILIVNYQANPGIKYGYALPVNDDKPKIAPPLIRRPLSEPSVLETRRLDPPPYQNGTQKDEARLTPHFNHRRTRLRRRYFHWKLTGLTACSKSCGGGLQTYVRTCVREIHPQSPIPVNDKRCAHLEPPTNHPIRCNTEPCPPTWVGYWGDCSATCGDGVQQFHFQCRDGENGRVMGDSECQKPKPQDQSRTCRINSCESDNNELMQNPEATVTSGWVTGQWSVCSASCGTGYRSRTVTCPVSTECAPSSRPKHADYCEIAPCVLTTTPAPLSHTTHSSLWLLSDWSQCSAACGTGTQNRLTFCPKDNCGTPPETSRDCSSDKECAGQWFTGPWGHCSDSCSGQAKQKREVFCVVKIRGQSHITNEMTCTTGLKPVEEQACQGVCRARWFMGDWGECEGGCPTGVQRREVKCLEAGGEASNACLDEDQPAVKRSCACDQRREDSREKYKPAQDEPADRSCVDRIRKCKLAVQARLCHYPYYTNHCCESCRRAQQDMFE